MQLTTGQQRALFAVLVILLAGVGIYLVGPGRTHSTTAAPPASASPAAVNSALTPQQGVPSVEIAPTPVPVPTVIKSANIYDWLPFTQDELKAAANVTLAFVAADQTFNQSDSAGTYGQRLKNLVTPTFLVTLEQQFRPPGAAGMTSRSSGTIVQVATFGANPKSITFVVTLTDQSTTGGKTTSTTTQNDVTTIAVAGGWQVNDLELAGVGN
jgi:hypothetical protein